MGVPRLNACCFVFDLKIGTTVAGIVNSVLCFILLVSLSITASIFSDWSLLKPDPDVEAEATGRYVLTILLVLMYLIKFFADIVFSYGVLREDRRVLKGYGIAWILFFLLSSFMFFLHVTDYHAFIIIMVLVYIALNIYIAILGYNMYEQINNREDI